MVQRAPSSSSPARGRGRRCGGAETRGDESGGGENGGDFRRESRRDDWIRGEI